MIISTTGCYFSMILKQIHDVTGREMPHQHTSMTHTSIFKQNNNKVMFFMIIYPLLINIKAQKY